MSSRLIFPEARERLRVQQAEEAKAVSNHTVACSRLNSVLERRAELLATQERFVLAAEEQVAVAAAGVVAVSGFARTAAILGATPASLRRQIALAKAGARSQASAEQPASPRSGR
jgi:hypothetical protein